MTETLLNALTDSLSLDLRAFAPELVMSGAIILLLLIRLIPRYDRLHLGWIALVVSIYVCFISWLQWSGTDSAAWLDFLKPASYDPRIPPEGAPEGTPTPLSLTLFGGMLVFDNFAIFIKMFLYSFTAFVVLLCLLTGIPDKEDSADFICLLFGSVIGMSVMASASHLLMVFIGVEMASLPSYALAGFLKGRRQSSEAALKYVVYGGGASGVMLYGISLIAGRFGTGYIPELVRIIGQGGGFTDPLVLMGMVFILAGIGFKLAAFPFHFWCPDVFEGAAAEVGAFLSVASKGAALALLARVVLGLGGLTGKIDDLAINWSRATDYVIPVLSIFAVATTTFGNLAAYGQTNLKRLLAYSTIAHAGFMMMGLATMTREGAGAVLFYLVVYLFMNLGAFAVVAFIRNQTGQEDLSYFRGYVYRSPLLVITLAVFLMSLLGMPPLGGWIAKFQIFSVLYEAAVAYAGNGKMGLSWTMYAVLVAAGLNTVLSLFYYIKVLKVMCLEKTLEEVEDRPVATIPLPVIHSAYLTILALAILFLGVGWNPLSSDKGVNAFHAIPKGSPAAAQLKGGD